MKGAALSDAPRLADCPFCGKSPAVTWRRVNPKAKCETHGCMASKLPVIALDDPESVAAWNLRARLTAEQSVSTYKAELIAAIEEPTEEMLAAFQTGFIKQLHKRRHKGGESAELGGLRAMLAVAMNAAALSTQPPAEPAAPHVGDSDFETWYSNYRNGFNVKQGMRDAYAAGMSDRAPVTAEQGGADFDRMAAVHHCYATLGHAQGEKASIAFLRGAEWHAALTTQPQAPAVATIRHVRVDGEWLAPSAQPQAEPASQLYERLALLSKMLESSGRIDELDHRDAYPTVLDAMNFVRDFPPYDESDINGWHSDVDKWARSQK